MITPSSKIKNLAQRQIASFPSIAGKTSEISLHSDAGVFIDKSRKANIIQSCPFWCMQPNKTQCACLKCISACLFCFFAKRVERCFLWVNSAKFKAKQIYLLFNIKESKTISCSPVDSLVQSCFTLDMLIIWGMF